MTTVAAIATATPKDMMIKHVNFCFPVACARDGQDFFKHASDTIHLNSKNVILKFTPLYDSKTRTVEKVFDNFLKSHGWYLEAYTVTELILRKRITHN